MVKKIFEGQPTLSQRTYGFGDSIHTQMARRAGVMALSELPGDQEQDETDEDKVDKNHDEAESEESPESNDDQRRSLGGKALRGFVSH